MINELWMDWMQYMRQGGIVMWPLLLCTVTLWYTLGHRFLFLQRGSRLATRNLIDFMLNKPLVATKGFVDTAIAVTIRVRKNYAGDIHHFLDDELFPLEEALGRFKSLIRTIVLVSPLLGLLGTVMGMIEMFNSLESQTFYSQAGGVANGISQALFTTQFGLVIAVPGMIFGRILDSREKKIKNEINQIKDYFNTVSKEGIKT